MNVRIRLRLEKDAFEKSKKCEYYDTDRTGMTPAETMELWVS